ncbi:ABC-type transport auxiliary lipoprotein family protein [Campylobacterota bacterium]
MRSLLIYIIILLLIDGCAIRPEAKAPITKYYLEPNIKLDCTLSKNNKTMRLNFIEGVSYVSQKNITYTKSNLVAGSYLYSKWNQSPNHLIATVLYSTLNKKNIFDNIVYENELVNTDIALNIQILQFEHKFYNAKNSTGVIALEALIYDTKTQRILASKLFTSEVEAKTNNAQGGVEALNEALGILLSKLICWSVENCE